MARKKKTVHWTKLPRAKLVGMVKKLELANAKLKTQLAECRETKLLNDGVALSAMSHPRTTTARVPADINPDALQTVELEKGEDDIPLYTQSRTLFPWETK